MKKVFSLILICALLSCVLCSCGEQILELSTADVTQIAATSATGGSLTLEKSEDVTSVLLALQNADCKTSSTAQEELPQEQYRFTAYNQDNTAINTFTIFSDEYLQVDTVLYKGNLADLLNIFDGYFKVNALSDLSSAFTGKSEEVIEIAFFNITEKTFKVVTLQKDIQSILSPLQALKISEKNVSGDPTEEYALYIRLKNSDEYLPAVEISRHESGTLCASNGKSTQVSNYNWSVLYEKLEYNTMPIK